MGPMSSATCRSCGKTVTIPGKSFLIVVLPMLVIFAGIQLLDLGILSNIVIILVTGAILSLVQLKFVPLIKDKLEELL